MHLFNTGGHSEKWLFGTRTGIKGRRRRIDFLPHCQRSPKIHPQSHFRKFVFLPGFNSLFSFVVENIFLWSIEI